MYKSPIEIIQGQIRMEQENNIMRAVIEQDIHVDKEELLRALQYDRGQYKKGYQDGYMASKEHGQWIDRYGGKYANRLYECSECKKSAPYDFMVDALGHEHIIQVLSDYCPNCGAKMDGGEDDD